LDWEGTHCPMNNLPGILFPSTHSIRLVQYTTSHEQGILNLLSSVISPLTYNSLSKGQILCTLRTHDLLSHDLPNDIFLVSALPRGWSGENLRLAVLSPHLFARGGGGGGARWGLPCPRSLLTGGCGRGAGDNPSK
jgi:hypothetical protein